MKFIPILESNPSQEMLDLLGKGIDEFNISKTGFSGNRDLTFFVRDEQENIIGGVHGNFNQSGWLYISAIWVAESHRSQGIGLDLMEYIEKEAIKNGCVHSYLNTIEFQAPKFYEKMGYEIFATLENFHDGFNKYFLKKELKGT